MLSTAHIIFFLIFVPLSIVLAIYASKKFGWDKRILYICCGIAVLSELTKVFYLVDEFPNGFYLQQGYLPFNLCSIQIIFIFIITFSTSTKIKNPLIAFMYPTMLGGALMAMLIPTSSVDHGFISAISFQFWIFHAMLMFLALYMIITKPIKFSIKSYFTALILLAFALVMSIYINSIVGGSDVYANFFFVARPPMDGLPILNLEHGWHVYILHLVWLGVLLVSLAYIPVFLKAIKERKNKKWESEKVNSAP